ncbi:sensor histidine kinase [Chitiniphilus shinanonensis]|uniref:sensor histidine kinase n=1 Tax=Chitiniphilus shinanonensis TaxID=553088 RepID=UPI00303A8E7D
MNPQHDDSEAPPRPWWSAFSRRLPAPACEPADTRWRSLLLLLIVNQGIALLLLAAGISSGLWPTFLIANCVGIVIYTAYAVAQRLVPWYWARHALALPFGLLLGLKLAALAGAYDVTQSLLDPVTHWRLVVTCLLIAMAATIVISQYFHNLEYRAQLAAEQRRAAEARQAETAAQLALLQAQIEPHFLFNTLATVHGLIERDPPLARTMLDHLNGYLRASLGRTRRPSTTLGDELELIGELLAIAAIRLQARLRYRIDVPDALRRAVLPPLLLQPLVENALEHGIEPALHGGEIVIEGRLDADGLLHLDVRDSGPGLRDGQPAFGDNGAGGVGLANVRQRLATLYGDAGRLALYPNAPHGVHAELRLPYREA